VLPQRATSYTWAHTQTSPHIFRLCVYAFAQATKHASMQSMCKFQPHFQGEQIGAKLCDLYINKHSIFASAAWNQAKSCGSARPDLQYMALILVILTNHVDLCGMVTKVLK